MQATRKPKEHEAPDTLYGRWRTEATEGGHDPDTLVRTVTDRTPNRDQDRTVSAEVTGRLFDRLAGPTGLTKHASTFARPDVLVALGAGLAGAGRVGDVRHGSTKRVASAVGEGSIAIRLIHEYLSQPEA